MNMTGQMKQTTASSGKSADRQPNHNIEASLQYWLYWPVGLSMKMLTYQTDWDGQMERTNPGDSRLVSARWRHFSLHPPSQSTDVQHPQPLP